MCANSIVTDVRELEWKWRCVMLYVLSIRTISYVCILKLWTEINDVEICAVEN